MATVAIAEKHLVKINLAGGPFVTINTIYRICVYVHNNFFLENERIHKGKRGFLRLDISFNKRMEMEVLNPINMCLWWMYELMDGSKRSHRNRLRPVLT